MFCLVYSRCLIVADLHLTKKTFFGKQHQTGKHLTQKCIFCLGLGPIHRAFQGSYVNRLKSAKSEPPQIPSLWGRFPPGRGEQMSTPFSGLSSTAVCFGGVSIRSLLGVKWDERLPPRVASS